MRFTWDEFINNEYSVAFDNKNDFLSFVSAAKEYGIPVYNYESVWPNAFQSTYIAVDVNPYGKHNLQYVTSNLWFVKNSYVKQEVSYREIISEEDDVKCINPSNIDELFS